MADLSLSIAAGSALCLLDGVSRSSIRCQGCNYLGREFYKVDLFTKTASATAAEAEVHHRAIYEVDRVNNLASLKSMLGDEVFEIRGSLQKGVHPPLKSQKEVSGDIYNMYIRDAANQICMVCTPENISKGSWPKIIWSYRTKEETLARIEFNDPGVGSSGELHVVFTNEDLGRDLKVLILYFMLKLTMEECGLDQYLQPTINSQVGQLESQYQSAFIQPQPKNIPLAPTKLPQCQPVPPKEAQKTTSQQLSAQQPNRALLLGQQQAISPSTSGQPQSEIPALFQQSDNSEPGSPPRPMETGAAQPMANRPIVCGTLELSDVENLTLKRISYNIDRTTKQATFHYLIQNARGNAYRYVIKCPQDGMAELLDASTMAPALHIDRVNSRAVSSKVWSSKFKILGYLAQTLHICNSFGAKNMCIAHDGNEGLARSYYLTQETYGSSTPKHVAKISGLHTHDGLLLQLLKELDDSEKALIIAFTLKVSFVHYNRHMPDMVEIQQSDAALSLAFQKLRVTESVNFPKSLRWLPNVLPHNSTFQDLGQLCDLTRVTIQLVACASKNDTRFFFLRDAKDKVIYIVECKTAGCDPIAMVKNVDSAKTLFYVTELTAPKLISFVSVNPTTLLGHIDEHQIHDHQGKQVLTINQVDSRSFYRAKILSAQDETEEPFPVATILCDSTQKFMRVNNIKIDLHGQLKAMILAFAIKTAYCIYQLQTEKVHKIKGIADLL